MSKKITVIDESNSVDVVDESKSSELLRNEVLDGPAPVAFDQAIAKLSGWRFWCTMLG